MMPTYVYTQSMYTLSPSLPRSLPLSTSFFAFAAAAAATSAFLDVLCTCVGMSEQYKVAYKFKMHICNTRKKKKLVHK